jgi:hypothetical protein
VQNPHHFVGELVEIGDFSEIFDRDDSFKKKLEAERCRFIIANAVVDLTSFAFFLRWRCWSLKMSAVAWL